MGKSGPNATFNLIFLGLGWPWGWGARRFHDNVYIFSNPTELGTRKHRITDVLGYMLLLVGTDECIIIGKYS